MKNILFTAVLFFSVLSVLGQSFKFAQVTDTHIGGSTGADDLRRTVADLNQQKELDFVILSGDVTEFGSDDELKLAKQILDSLRLPLYIIPGNHDSNWSESGANSFRKIFGSEMFFFEHKGYQFLGTTSGPNMRMSPGQIPRENLVWVDSVFTKHADKNKPLISINHYPLDSSLNNWYSLVDRLHERNIQLALCGHGHINKLYNWDGIPGVMSRSNLRAKDEVGGYNIVTIANDTAYFQVRRPLMKTEKSWLKVELKKHQFRNDYPRPSFAMNTSAKVKVLWEFQDQGDIGAGISTDGKRLFTANTVGEIYAIDIKSGKKLWSYRTSGKIYSTPAYDNGVVVVGSSDHYIYGLDAKNGIKLWSLKTDKAVLGSAAIKDGFAFIGGSDGIFRCIQISNGQLKWTFSGVKNYVSTLPTIADNKVIFGSWGNGFYALDIQSGNLVWEWNNGHANRMFSAAACYPVVANNKVFIVAPDRYMTALDLKTGKVIWREKKDPFRVRESIGLSRDKMHVYAKTMDGELIGVSTQSDEMDVNWKSSLKLPYELAPTAIYSDSKYTFVPNNSGVISAVNSKTGNVAWQYKITNAMINPPLVLKNKIALSTMDGKIVMLSY